VPTQRPIWVVQENNRLLGESVKRINVLCGRMQSYEVWEQVVQSDITEL